MALKIKKDCIFFNGLVTFGLPDEPPYEYMLMLRATVT